MAIQAKLYSENLGFSLGGSQDFLRENGPCGGFNNFCFIPQQNQEQKQTQQQLMQFDQFQNQKNIYNNFVVDENNINGIPLLLKTNMNDHLHHESVSALLEKQRTEIDRFISLQNERLIQALQDQRKHQTTHLMNKYQSKIQFLLNQKQEELTKASTKRTELENLLKKMEIENQTWQRVAKENEAMVASLNGTIERLRHVSEGEGNAAEDAESCCCLEEEEEKEKRTEEGNWARGTMKMICRSCHCRMGSVIMLPCRHLCCCRDCETVLDSCPVCGMVKKASIEALI